MSFTRVITILVGINVTLSCGKPSSSFTKDVGSSSHNQSVVLHFNKVNNTIEVWHCRGTKVPNIRDCKDNGKRSSVFANKELFEFIVKALKDNEQEITTTEHRAWVKLAADAILKNELSKIKSAQARHAIDLQQVREYIEAKGDELDSETLQEKQQRQLELVELVEHANKQYIAYRKTVELIEGFIALVEGGSIFYQQLSDVPTFELIFSKLSAGIAERAGMTFVHIPAGSFVMGASSREVGAYSFEGPPHHVTISQSFEMQTTELTCGQWYILMRHSSNSRLTYRCKDGEAAGFSLPVSDVSWNDVQKYIEKLNDVDFAYHYRLPTEAEWEYAARAGTTGRFSVSGPIEDFAWYKGNSGLDAQPVGQLKPNAFGLYDMHGNVAEWVADRYSHYRETSQIDPQGPSSGAERVVRGGWYYQEPKRIRSAARFWSMPSDRGPDTGFRLVRTPKQILR